MGTSTFILYGLTGMDKIDIVPHITPEAARRQVHTLKVTEASLPHSTTAALDAGNGRSKDRHKSIDEPARWSSLVQRQTVPRCVS